MTAVLKKISQDFKIPYDQAALQSGDPSRIAAYLLELAETLQLLLRDLVDVANFTIALADGDAVYFALPDKNGDYPVGTWRMKQVGDDLETQVQLTLGVWTFAGKRERPI